MGANDELRQKITKALKTKQSGAIKKVSSVAVELKENILSTNTPKSETVEAPVPPPTPTVMQPTKVTAINDYSINEFPSLADLRIHLNKCAEQKQGFHLITTHPVHNILDFVQQKVTESESFSTFDDAIAILYLTQIIQPSSDYLTYVNNLLKSYQKKIPALMRNDSVESLSQLDMFFVSFKKNKIVNQLRKELSDSLNPFSSQHHIHQTLAEIDTLQAKLNKKRELTSRQSSQKDYAQLLGIMLEGASPESVIPLLRPQITEESENESTLLPKNEYDVPSAEPEYPGRIGINKTMSFIPPKDRPSIISAFSSKMLIEEFMRSFYKWAVDKNSLSKLQTKIPTSDINLLDTDMLLSSKIQFAVIRYLLLSIDTLGKICGQNGDLAIQNYTIIKDISVRLQLISDKLKNLDNSNNASFLSELKVMTKYLSSKNEEFYNMQKEYNPAVEVRHNSEINGFCHINEYLSSRLLAVNYRKSILTPDQPSASLLKKINLAFDRSATEQTKNLKK